MTGPELLEVFRAMTARPWRDEPEPRTAGGWRAVLSGQAAGPGATVAQWLLPGDAAAIVAIANHAVPLADLAGAAERLKAWQDGEERRAEDLDAALDGIVSALDRVHAVTGGAAAPGPTEGP